ncbi:MAG: TetR/AcrR family transcriptional regulator [Flammeovirgaceae bacterium]
MSKRNSNREQTKQRIIEASSVVFNKKGVLGTSLSDIEKATALTKGSIYGNFKNKEEVALKAFQHNYGLLKKGISAKIREAQTAREELMAYIHFYRENYQFHFTRGGCPILNAGIDADDANIEVLEAVNKAIRDWQRHLSRVIQKGQEAEEWNTPVQAENFVTLFISLLEGGIFLAKTTGDIKHLLRNLDHLEQTILEL